MGHKGFWGCQISDANDWGRFRLVLLRTALWLLLIESSTEDACYLYVPGVFDWWIQELAVRLALYWKGFTALHHVWYETPNTDKGSTNQCSKQCYIFCRFASATLSSLLLQSTAQFMMKSRWHCIQGKHMVCYSSILLARPKCSLQTSTRR